MRKASASRDRLSSAGTLGGASAERRGEPPVTEADIMHEYNLDRSRVMDKYSRRRKDLDLKGVFDPSTNAMRAQTMMQFELGRSTVHALKHRVEERRKGKVTESKIAEERNQRKAQTQQQERVLNKAESLEMHLNSLHENYTQQASKALDDKKTRERNEKARKSIEGKAGPASSVHPRRMPPRTAPDPLQAPVVADEPPMSQRAKMTPTVPAGTFDASKEKTTRPPPMSPSNIAPSKRLSLTMTNASEPTSPTSLKSLSPTAGQSPSNKEQQPQPQSEARALPTLKVRDEPPAFGVADWMQRSLEHSSYPAAEVELRNLMKKRDEVNRGKTPVERYTQPRMANRPKAKLWEAQAVKVAPGGTFRTTSLTTHVESVSGKTPRDQIKPEELHPEKTQTHMKFLSSIDEKRRRRKEFKRRVHNELVESKDILHPSHHLREDVAEEPDGLEYTSSEDEHRDEEEVEFLKHLQQNEKMRAGSGEGEEICELLETAVVCLCEDFSKKRSGAGASSTRDTTLVRNILLHGLITLLPVIRLECNRRRLTFENTAMKEKGAASSSGIQTNPAVARIMRSWVKAVDMLLSCDLDLTTPFSVQRQEHIASLVDMYCSYHSHLAVRSTSLLTRWRKQRETVAADGGGSPTVLDTSSGSLDASHTAGGTSPSKLHEKGQELVEFFTNATRITSDDLAQLDIGESNLLYNQKNIATAFLSRFQKFLPTQSESEESAAAARSAQTTKRLRNVLLEYVGVLHSEESDEEKDRVLAKIIRNSRLSNKSVASFMNVMHFPWARTPLAHDVTEEEAHERARCIEYGNVINVMDVYLRMCSFAFQKEFKESVQRRKRELAENERKVNMRRAAEAVQQEAEAKKRNEAERIEALQHVEKEMIIRRYTKHDKKDAEKLEALQHSVEATDVWYGFDATRRPQSNKDAEVPLDSSTDVTSPTNASGGATRMEIVRIRKLQDLESCWQSLRVNYQERIALHDKWNSKDVKAIDRALKVYKDAVAAVDHREKALQDILENEELADARIKTTKRHELFSVFCSAGQLAEIAAKKLQLDSGDVLVYRDTVYINKMKDDYNHVVKLLRTSGVLI